MTMLQWDDSKYAERIFQNTKIQGEQSDIFTDKWTP